MTGERRQIIARIPQKGMSGEEWGFVVENELKKLWLESMSESERDAFSESVEQRRLEVLPKRLLNRLDRLILTQAGTLGWRIRLSKLVQFRMSDWDSMANGPENFRQMGIAEARSARILQRRELAPLDPDLRAVKQETVSELRLLLKTLRAYFAMTRRWSSEDMRERFATTIAESSETFPHVSANLDRWMKFLEENRNTLTPTTHDRIKPGALYDEFLAWCTGRDPEALRQAIAQLPAAKL